MNKKRNTQKVLLNGELVTKKAWCKYYGVSYHVCMDYIRKHPDEDVQEILEKYKNTPNKGYREMIIIDGVSYTGRDFCKKYSLDYSLFLRFKVSQINKSYTEIANDFSTMSLTEIYTHIHFHQIYCSMMSRCYNPKHVGYRWYGGKKPKPVTVCDRWHDYANFKFDMWDSYIIHVDEWGIHQTTLDRKKPWYNYSYEECQWKDYKYQNQNRSNLKYFLPSGEGLYEYCQKNNYSYSAITKLISRRNLTVEEALLIYLENKDNAKVKYRLFTGESLYSFCACNHLPYRNIVSAIERYNLTPDEALAKYYKH